MKGNPRTLDMHIKTLRKKLGESGSRTKRSEMSDIVWNRGLKDEEKD